MADTSTAAASSKRARLDTTTTSSSSKGDGQQQHEQQQPPAPPITATHYRRIRFIGYCIPTTPANIVPVGDPNGQGMVGGTYLGHEDLATDIRARVGVLKAAAAAAQAALKETKEEEGEEPKDVLTVFMAPEFFWHGDEGPYLHARGDPDPADAILQALQEAFFGEGGGEGEGDGGVAAYRDWLIVGGTAITARVEDRAKLYGLNSTMTRNAVVGALAEQWRNSYGPLSEVILDTLVAFIKQCHAYPLLEVRNRALIVNHSHLGLDSPGRRFGVTAMTSDKYFCSNEDLLLYEVNGKHVVTEQMMTYQSIDLTAGDLKRHPRDRFAVFRLHHGGGQAPPLDAAVEICLDHRDVRLRRNLDHHPFPDRARDFLHLQLVPSCGMQLKANGVAVDEGGWAFNVDGQYALAGSGGGNGGGGSGGATSGGASSGASSGVLNGVACVYTDHVSATAEGYAGHSQLARVQKRAVSNHVHAKGSRDAVFEPDVLDPARVRVVPVKPVKGLDVLFAGGPGELHIYGPLPLWPASSSSAFEGRD